MMVTMTKMMMMITLVVMKELDTMDHITANHTRKKENVMSAVT